MTDRIYLPENATDKDIAKAIGGLTAGGTVVLPKNANIAVTSPIVTHVDASDITIDLNGGSLKATGNFSVIDVYGIEKPLYDVKLGLDPSGNTTLTYSQLPEGIRAGSWLKITSDTPLPGDHIDAGDNGRFTNLGQAAEVIGIDGNTVTLRGALVDRESYIANVRAALYSEGHFSLLNGHVSGNQSSFTELGPALIRVRSLTDTSISDVTVSDASNGVAFINNVNASAVDVAGTNLYSAIQSATSLGTSINGLFAEHVAHGVLVHTTGTAPNASSPSNYGADIGLVARNSVVYDAAKAAFDFHSESRNGIYSDSLAFDSRMFGDLRGIGNAFLDSAGAGNAYGVQFYEYGDGDGKNSLVSKLVLRETVNYSFIVSGDPQGNLVKDSSFESYGKGYTVSPSRVSFVNTVIKQNVIGDNDVIAGTTSNDKMLGGKGVDLLYGMDGDDYLWGGQQADFLDGGAGRDRFAYNELKEGGDVITGFKTGSDGDVIDVSVLGLRLGWDSGDYIAEGHLRVIQLGTDTAVQVLALEDWTTLAVLDNVLSSSFTPANLQVKLSEALPQFEYVKVDQYGTSASDWLTGSPGADIFHGSEGDDSYIFNSALDQFAEGADGGNDTIWASLGVDIRGLNQIENIRLQESAGVATIFGNASGNLLTGNSNTNTIVSGLGNDRIYGKGGADTFVFAEAGPANADSIWDFDRDDRIALEASYFRGLDGNGDGLIDEGAFSFGTNSTSSHPQIVYDNNAGKLYYDSDGVGGDEPQLVVNLPTAKAFFDIDSVLLL